MIKIYTQDTSNNLTHNADQTRIPTAVTIRIMLKQKSLILMTFAY